MNLYDQIIDEAEELANQQVLAPGATCEEITEAISQIIGIPLQSNSIFAKLAEAAYNRYNLAALVT